MGAINDDSPTSSHERVDKGGTVSKRYRTQQQRTRASGFAKGMTIHSDTVKIGRNQPCPCESGQKYKRCCGRTSP